MIFLGITLVHAKLALDILAKSWDTSVVVDFLDDIGLLHYAEIAMDGDVQPWIGDLHEIGRNFTIQKLMLRKGVGSFSIR